MPTSTPLPTVTPFPPLSGMPPYLILRTHYESQELIVYDHDGKGKRVIELSQSDHIMGQLAEMLSPDGKWLAFYKGNVSFGEDPESLPVSLYILNIADGTTKKIADVVTEGYSPKLDIVAETLKEMDPERYKPIDNMDWVRGSVETDFKWTIYSVAWSPDSHYLAFGAQIDGNSSDVYLYDMKLETIQRVNDDIQNVSRIEWSPDGNYIIFQNSIPSYVSTGSSLHIVMHGNETVKDPKSFQAGTWWTTKAWLSPTLLLISDGTHTAGDRDLKVLDIRSGQVNHLWKDSFSGFAIDYENQIIALNSSEFSEPVNLGFYLIPFSGTPKKIFDGLLWLNLHFRGGEKHRFIVYGGSEIGQYTLSGDFAGITLDNQLTLLGKFGPQNISISPDYTWLLLYNGKDLNLYDRNDELLQTFSIDDIRQILWRPDSQGVFYSTGKELYYFSIPDGSSKFIDSCTTENCRFDLSEFYSAWID